MKKVIKIISYILIVFVLGVLVYHNLDKDTSTSVEADTGYYTVTLVNGNTNAGNTTIYIKSGDEYTDSMKTTLKVEKGTKVKFYIELNEDYSIYLWATSNDGLLVPTSANDTESGYYEKNYLVKTINSDITLNVYGKKADDHVVTYYNTALVSKRSVVGYSIVHDGEDANYKNIKAPKVSGNDFSKWSESLKNITSDMEVYPVYTANVYTVFRDYHEMFFKGLGVTLLLSVVSVFCALFLGAAITLAKMSNIHLLKFICSAYVEIIRGVPLLLQLLVVYIILGPTRIHVGSFFSTEVISCLLALFINSSAYVSEIFRSGVQAVDKGQMEAGRALGLSKWQVLMKIVMPQGIKNSLPSIGNELVMIIKETSLAVSIDASIGELMCVRKQITSATYINLPPYIIVAMIYFIVTFTLSKLIGLLEKRLQTHD